MKALRLMTVLLVAAMMSLAADSASAQRGNDEPRQSPNAGLSQTIGTTVIDLHYSRPGVKGRTVFGELAPWGDVWRAGANEPTTITFSGPVEVEGQALEAGTYNIFIRPNENAEWDVIFTTPVRWGTMFSDATPVVEVAATPEDATAQEWLAYTFESPTNDSAELVLHWAETRLPVTISVAE